MSEPTYPGRHRHDDPELTARQRAVLSALIDLHAPDAAPVSSERIARTGRVGVSGASVRSALAELEELGLLERSHASAGRAPSARGWDYFVRSLLEPTALPAAIEAEIDAQLNSSHRDVERLLHDASRLLATLTRQLGLAVAITLGDEPLTSLALEALGDGRALLALELSRGTTRTVVLELDSPLPRRALAEVESVLRERLVGRTLAEARRCLESDAELATHSAARIVARAAAASWNLGLGTPLLSHGAGHIAEQPEFAEAGRVAPVLRTVEAGAPLDRLMVHGIEGHVGLRIGVAESRALVACSLVSFALSGPLPGAVGVLGPLRMDYALTMAVVDRVGSRVADLLSA